jgi:hypothetical protein
VRSFSDAEAAEDQAEQIIRRHFSEDATQCVERFAQFHRDDFRAGFDRVVGARQGLAGFDEGGDVAGVERETDAAGCAEGELIEMVAELFEALAGPGGDMKRIVDGELRVIFE